MSVRLSDELQKRHSKRSVRVKKGDKVKIMKGQFKGKSGNVESVDSKTVKVYVAGIEFQKKDGTKIKYPISPSNIMITELSLTDKKRQESLKRK